MKKLKLKIQSTIPDTKIGAATFMTKLSKGVVGGVNITILLCCHSVFFFFLIVHEHEIC